MGRQLTYLQQPEVRPQKVSAGVFGPPYGIRLNSVVGHPPLSNKMVSFVQNFY